jgi:transposase
VVYRWTNGAGWVKPTSYELMKMKAVNHKPMIHLEGTLALQGGEEVRAGNHIGGINYKFSGLVGTAITKYKDYLIARRD